VGKEWQKKGKERKERKRAIITVETTVGIKVINHLLKIPLNALMYCCHTTSLRE
jgi:hypothetical protein